MKNFVVAAYSYNTDGMSVDHVSAETKLAAALEHLRDHWYSDDDSYMDYLTKYANGCFETLGEALHEILKIEAQEI